MTAKVLWVQVCVWDPIHTLERALAQREAVADGTVAKLMKKHGEGTEALLAALTKAKLVMKSRGLSGGTYCPACGALMESVMAPPGVTDKIAGLRAVAEDFQGAINRTRGAPKSP
jgi:hypothetical protein